MGISSLNVFSYLSYDLMDHTHIRKNVCDWQKNSNYQGKKLFSHNIVYEGQSSLEKLGVLSNCTRDVKDVRMVYITS
jgi:hypothetical protein